MNLELTNSYGTGILFLQNWFYPAYSTQIQIADLMRLKTLYYYINFLVKIFVYKGDDIKIIINDLQHLKPNLRDTIISRMDEIDLVMKNDNKSQVSVKSSARIGKNSKVNHSVEKKLNSKTDHSLDDNKLNESGKNSIKLGKIDKNKLKDTKGKDETISKSDNNQTNQSIFKDKKKQG